MDFFVGIKTLVHKLFQLFFYRLVHLALHLVRGHLLFKEVQLVFQIEFGFFSKGCGRAVGFERLHQFLPCLFDGVFFAGTQVAGQPDSQRDEKGRQSQNKHQYTVEGTPIHFLHGF